MAINQVMFIETVEYYVLLWFINGVFVFVYTSKCEFSFLVIDLFDQNVIKCRMNRAREPKHNCSRERVKWLVESGNATVYNLLWELSI